MEDMPVYKDEVYLPSYNENYLNTKRKAVEAGFKFFCETTHSDDNWEFSIWPHVKNLNGVSVVLFSELKDRDANDAWKLYDDLVESLTKVISPRGDIEVHAQGWDRSVQLVLKDFLGKPHNVGTMRLLAECLIEACDYVESVNPEWAKSLPAS